MQHHFDVVSMFECCFGNSASRWCSVCKSKTHDTKYCSRKNTAKSANDNKDYNSSDDSSFAFKSSVISNSESNLSKCDNLLVDCGATAHILNDVNKFVSFENNFDAKNHAIELADGTRSSGIVTAKGNAEVNMCDSNGKINNVTLKKTLCIPTYNQNKFSVQAATENGSSVTFTPTSSELKLPRVPAFPLQREVSYII